MKELTHLLAALGGSVAEQTAAKQAFRKTRAAIWEEIRDGRFPANYTSSNNRKFSGAPRRTAIRCDFLLANKAVLGPKYAKDRISDMAQRDLLFYVLRDREVFPTRTGREFYCCPRCTSKLYECVSAKVFRYIDNAKWKAAIESGQGAARARREPRATTPS